MKKIISLIIGLFLLGMMPQISFAQNTKSTELDCDKNPRGSIECFLPTIPQSAIQASQEAINNDPSSAGGDVNVTKTWLTRLGEFYRLPRGSFASIVAGVISLILALGGTLAVIAIFVAGVFYIIARENEDMVGKAKQIIVNAVIGIIVISISFAIFTGLSRLLFT